MTLHGCCPQCGSEIAYDRFIEGQAICECGWFDPRSAHKARLKTERKVIVSMLISSVLLIGLFTHLVSWGSFAMVIPGLKAQQLTGTLSVEGYQTLTTICTELGKYDCAKKALS